MNKTNKHNTKASAPAEKSAQDGGLLEVFAAAYNAQMSDNPTTGSLGPPIGDALKPTPTPQDHIRDLHDAATRFEDRAKRAEAHAEALAEALRELRDFTINIIEENAEPSLEQCIDARETATQALAEWTASQSSEGAQQ